VFEFVRTQMRTHVSDNSIKRASCSKDLEITQKFQRGRLCRKVLQGQRMGRTPVSKGTVGKVQEASV